MFKFISLFIFLNLFCVVESIEIFLGLECLYCNESLEVICRFKEKYPLVKVVCYLFLSENDYRSPYLISSLDDFKLFCLLMKYRFNKHKFLELIKSNNFDIRCDYLLMLRSHAAMFKTKKIVSIPTWILNEKIIVKGIPDDMFNFLCSI